MSDDELDEEYVKICAQREVAIGLANETWEKYDITYEFTNYDLVGTEIDNKDKRIIEAKFKALKKDELVKEAMELMQIAFTAAKSLWNHKGYFELSFNVLEYDLVNKQKREGNDKIHEATNAKLDDYLKNVNEKLTQWGDDITSKMDDIVKEKIAEALPEITKEVVKEATNSKKFSKPWSDLFKKTQDDFKGEANKVFRDTLSTALTESQHEIVERVQMKREADVFEKEKRSRNIVVSNCQESTSDKPSERLLYDKKFIKSLTEVSDGEILKCIRAGPKKDRESGDCATSRPIIVTLETPEIAKRLHKYGNGSRVIWDGKVWWINPDLSLSERQANFNARQYKKMRQQSKDQA